MGQGRGEAARRSRVQARSGAAARGLASGAPQTFGNGPAGGRRRRRKSVPSGLASGLRQTVPARSSGLLSAAVANRCSGRVWHGLLGKPDGTLLVALRPPLGVTVPKGLASRSWQTRRASSLLLASSWPREVPTLRRVRGVTRRDCVPARARSCPLVPARGRSWPHSLAGQDPLQPITVRDPGQLRSDTGSRAAGPRLHRGSLQPWQVRARAALLSPRPRSERSAPRSSRSSPTSSATPDTTPGSPPGAGASPPRAARPSSPGSSRRPPSAVR